MSLQNNTSKKLINDSQNFIYVKSCFMKLLLRNTQIKGKLTLKNKAQKHLKLTQIK